jgi:hypothetical protein
MMFDLRRMNDDMASWMERQRTACRMVIEPRKTASWHLLQTALWPPRFPQRRRTEAAGALRWTWREGSREAKTGVRLSRQRTAARYHRVMRTSETRQ